MLKTIRGHHNVKGYFQEFAEVSEIVFFGDIKKDDEAHIYKGVTFSPTAKDSNYCHGTVNEYDLTVFTRKASHSLHNETASNCEWTVLAVHLKMGGLPHFVLDARKHDRKFYQSIFTRFPRLRRASNVLNQLNQSAAHYFDMYIRPENNLFVSQFLDDSILQQLISNYSKYDIELDNDMLYVFKPGQPISVKELKDMLGEAMWLAETIENRAHYLSPVQKSNLA